MSMQSSKWLLSYCVSSALTVGCASSGTSTTTTDAVALVAVDPADFPRLQVAGRGSIPEDLDRSAAGGASGAPGFAAGAAGIAGTTNGWLAGAGEAGVGNLGTVAPAAAGAGGQSPAVALEAGAAGNSAILPRSAVGDCADGVGSYVAELVDVSNQLSIDNVERIADFPVQNSKPIACDRTVAFSRVVPNRLYEVRISTYSEQPDQLCSIPDEPTTVGTTVVVSRVGGQCTTQIVKPRQTGIICYGWQGREVVSGAGGASPIGDVGSSMPDSTSADSGAASQLGSPKGRPGLSIQYRTITLHYCVVGGPSPTQ